MKTLLLGLVASIPLALPLAGQHLRDAVTAADLVVIATDVGVRPAAAQWLVHKLRIEAVLKGEPLLKGEAIPKGDGTADSKDAKDAKDPKDANDARRVVSVVEVKGIALHQRPGPGETRLYCLQDFTAGATKAGLSPSHAPYFKLAGHPGSNPSISKDSGNNFGDDHAVRFARMLIEADRGLAPQLVADRLYETALRGPAPLRSEAVQLLVERRAVQANLTSLQWSELMTRAVAETEDIPHKIALAQLCAEQRLPRLVEELCASIDQISDVRFAQALGRIARVLHGERAHEVLMPAIERARSNETRGRLLLALGATSTEGALTQLLRQRQLRGDDRYLDAALQLHGARAALEALASRPQERSQERPLEQQREPAQSRPQTGR